MTPISNPTSDAQKMFNKKHIEARNCVERCIGLLKNRFRCLHNENTLRYSPDKVGKIVNVCVALHNICINHQIPHAADNQEPVVVAPQNRNIPSPTRAETNRLGEACRQHLMTNFFN